MFEKTRLLTHLKNENLRLAAENERLSRLQPGGLAAVYAEQFDLFVHSHVDGGGETGPEVSDRITDMDAIFESGVRHAAAETVLRSMDILNPAEKIKFAEHFLEEDTQKHVAFAGLERAVKGSPIILKDLLSSEELVTFVNQITTDETEREKILDALLVEVMTGNDAEAARHELQSFGYVSTDNLKEGSRVRLEVEDRDGDRYIIRGLVKNALDDQRWVHVLKDTRRRDYSGSDVIRPHSLVRFGYKDDMGRAVPKIFPKTPVNTIRFAAPEETRNKRKFKAVRFAIDGQFVFQD